MRHFCVLLLVGLSSLGSTLAATPTTPIMFVGQVPIQGDFGSMASTFGNQAGNLSAAPRGGGLFIRYPDGTVKDLTAAAGYGLANGMQGANAIAVRDPHLHWSGKKALFSMVVGAPTQRYQVAEYFWQMYQVSGLGANETPIITKVANQPLNRNNIYPFYNSKGSILFVSDAPAVGNAQHLYPPLDEYELSPVNSGIWILNTSTGSLRLINHAPSGDFKPFVDSFGRIIFSQWDHLQRDQESDADAMGGNPYGTFNYSSESATAKILPRQEEVFPEPRSPRTDLLAGTGLNGHQFNQFFPWQMNQDGTGIETINHVGRQEFGGSYMSGSRNDDPNVTDDYGQYVRANKNRISNVMQITESPSQKGTYYAIDAPEFGTFSAGQIIRFNAPPTLNASQMTVDYVTHRATASTADSPQHSGLYRDPLLTSTSVLVAAHTPNKAANSTVNYDFKLKSLKTVNGYTVPDTHLTRGIQRDISWWDPDTLRHYQGPLWELMPVEVKARPVPAFTVESALPAPEQAAFAQAQVDEAAFRAYLRTNKLALVVARNVTQRDGDDKIQPFNLRVPAGAKTAIAGQKLYDVAHAQILQGNLLRGFTGGGTTPRAGRRVLATPMNTTVAVANNPSHPLGKGMTTLGLDGSMAMIVPARRALTWQLTDPSGKPVVRERYWLTFQSGEVRVCASCHGINTKNQVGHAGEPQNVPSALVNLLNFWKSKP
ncbi:MAG: hypothetical protein RL180_1603 [Pseudomonadota bacterium]